MALLVTDTCVLTKLIFEPFLKLNTSCSAFWRNKCLHFTLWKSSVSVTSPNLPPTLFCSNCHLKESLGTLEQCSVISISYVLGFVFSVCVMGLNAVMLMIYWDSNLWRALRFKPLNFWIEGNFCYNFLILGPFHNSGAFVKWLWK